MKTDKERALKDFKDICTIFDRDGICGDIVDIDGAFNREAYDTIIKSLEQQNNEWQPIETAPKDKTLIQAFFPKETYLSRKIDYIKWDRTLCTGEDGWFTENGCWIPEYKYPTHWKPLQEIPEVE